MGSRKDDRDQMPRIKRLDKEGATRSVYDKNKRKIFKTQTVCGICGKPVDFSLKFPNPLSACIDHIIPIAKGGHPSDISNLQLAHLTCNRAKSDKLLTKKVLINSQNSINVTNRNLPHSMNWEEYKG